MSDNVTTTCGVDQGCRHRMFERCLTCRREQYAPNVWDYSHGGPCAWCGAPGSPRLFVAGDLSPP